MIKGYLDGVFGDRVCGWAMDPGEPQASPHVEVLVNDRPLLTTVASRFRPDLHRAGIGTGAYGFEAVLPPALLDGRPLTVAVQAGADRVPLPGSPFRVESSAPHVANFKIDVDSQLQLPTTGSWTVGLLLIELNDTCNAECVYCPNPRSTRRIDLERVARFLDERVASVDTVQFGCGQEPTADLRLGEAFRVLARSPLRPRKVRLITNGSLLHRHDAGLLRDCGLTTLAVSLDSADEATNDRLRPGAPFRKVVENLRAFRAQCPDVELELSVTVTRPTVGHMSELVSFGLGLGATRFVLREVVDTSRGAQRYADFRAAFESVALPAGAFDEMQARLTTEYPDVDIVFQPREELEDWVDSAYDGAHRLGVFTA
jgi:sulfatase maturation enzyme AslB (radical SAM superfamily)